VRKLSLEELNRASLQEYHALPKIPITVVLDDIRSAMNVGSFFRTSDAFRIREIMLCGITATPPHKEILKTAIGATSSVQWRYTEDINLAVQGLKEERYRIIGIEQTSASRDLYAFDVDITQRYALVFGNEVRGISEHILSLLDDALEIPQYGTKHSLNVAVCGGIVLSHFSLPFLRSLE